MSEDTITITSNWSQSNGSLSVTHVASAKDIDLDTMTPEACVLLSPLDGEDERCQVVLSGPVDSIVVITDCPRYLYLPSLLLIILQGESKKSVISKSMYIALRAIKIKHQIKF